MIPRIATPPDRPVRRLLDRSFGWMGFCATFFGLLILLFFFGQLLWSTIQWFANTPDLVRRENQRLQKKAELSDKERREAALKDISDEMKIFLDAATTEEEKKRIRDSYQPVIEERLANLGVEADEAKIFAERGIRPDQSAPALVGHYLTHNDSPFDSPQDAGIHAALLGSFLVAVIAILAAVPLGVGAAVYLEEYQQTGWLGRIIQVNINNLAGVPSVVYGILGGFVFVDKIFRPLSHRQYELQNHLAAGGGLLDQLVSLLPNLSYRNTLGGGLTLALLTLPMVIVASQEAIRAIPVSIRHGAHALGATLAGHLAQRPAVGPARDHDGHHLVAVARDWRSGAFAAVRCPLISRPPDCSPASRSCRCRFSPGPTGRRCWSMVKR